jgi:hypothetical protein
VERLEPHEEKPEFAVEIGKIFLEAKHIFRRRSITPS